MSQADSNAQWRIAVKEEQRGPFTLEQLRQMMAEGRLPADTLVWRPGMAHWAPLTSVPELASQPPQHAVAAAPVALSPSPSAFAEFLAFRRMITPVLIQAIFWLGVLVCVLWAVVAMRGPFGNALFALFVLLFGIVAWRVWCELIILAFRIHDMLRDIRDQRK